MNNNIKSVCIHGHLFQTNQSFHLAPGVCVSGLSPETVSAACQIILDCGTCYHRLTDFSSPAVIDSFYRAGLIFQAFTVAIRRYLQYYR